MADVARYRSERRFRFKGRNYDYTDRLHIMALSAYTQASVQNADQNLVLVDAENGKRKLTLTIMELQTLLDRCDRTLKRMEIARTRVDEVEA